MLGFLILIVIPQFLIPNSSFLIGAFGARLCAFVPLCLCAFHLTASTLTPEESETYYEKALILYGGVEEEADYDGAARLAKAAANAGHVKAQVLFGYMHSRGFGGAAQLESSGILVAAGGRAGLCPGPLQPGHPVLVSGSECGRTTPRRE